MTFYVGNWNEALKVFVKSLVLSLSRHYVTIYLTCSVVVADTFTVYVLSYLNYFK